MRVRFAYLTLVLQSPPDGNLLDSPAPASLDSPARHRYDAITERNFLVPYTPGEQPPPAPAPLSPEELERQRELNLTVVSLSSWEGRPEVDLADAEHQSILVRQPGDKLLDGEVVMIDYRALPVPGADGLLSIQPAHLADRQCLLGDRTRPDIGRPPPAFAGRTSAGP